MAKLSSIGQYNSQMGRGRSLSQSKVIPIIPALASFVTIAIGCLVLMGWQFDIDWLKYGFAAKEVSMQANTAVGFILSGISLGIIWKEEGRRTEEGRGQRAEGRRTEEGTLHEARGTRKEESRRNEEGSREEGRGQEFAHSSGSSHTPHPNHTLPLPLTASPRPRVSSSPSQISGVAYGSYGRTLLAPIFEKIETDLNAPTQLEKYPDLLWQAVAQAYSLVSQLKPASISNPPRGLIET